MKDTALTLTRPVQITHGQIASLLCNAFEGANLGAKVSLESNLIV